MLMVVSRRESQSHITLYAVNTNDSNGNLNFICGDSQWTAETENEVVDADR
jgi:hypothetical protein